MKAEKVAKSLLCCDVFTLWDGYDCWRFQLHPDDPECFVDCTPGISHVPRLEARCAEWADHVNDYVIVELSINHVKVINRVSYENAWALTHLTVPSCNWSVHSRKKLSNFLNCRMIPFPLFSEQTKNILQNQLRSPLCVLKRNSHVIMVIFGVFQVSGVQITALYEELTLSVRPTTFINEEELMGAGKKLQLPIPLTAPVSPFERFLSFFYSIIWLNRVFLRR